MKPSHTKEKASKKPPPMQAGEKGAVKLGVKKGRHDAAHQVKAVPLLALCHHTFQ